MALWLAAALSSGCLHNQAATDAYARQVTVATTRVAQLEATVVDAESRIRQLEETIRLQGQDQVTKLETVEQVNTEVGRIRGEIEVIQFELAEIKRMLEDTGIEKERRMLHSERRIAQIEKFLDVKPPPPPTDAELGIAEADPGDPVDGTASTDPEAPADPEAEVEAMELPDDAMGRLEFAVEHMKHGRTGVARIILEKIVVEFPGDALLPEVQYRVGETWFNDEKWSRAIKEFDVVINGYDDPEWGAWAMLRQAETFDRMGQPDNARLFYEEVVRVYPKAEAAGEAKEHLDK